jgi:hypothetical protein
MSGVNRIFSHSELSLATICRINLPVSLSYDLAHLTGLWLDLAKKRKLANSPLGWLDGQCVQGAGTYSPLDFTNRNLNIKILASDDQRLLGISPSWG